jgi:NAD+ synthase (glutamine-hydrolysing)
MKITLAQLNPTVGAIEQNLEKALDVIKENAASTDLIVFSELYLTGYPPRDLLFTHGFLDRVGEALEKLREISNRFPDTGLIMGVPTRRESGNGFRLHNSAILIQDKSILATCHKSLLPSYDVFDEPRYFEPAEEIAPVGFKGQKLGITVCEDYWNEPALWPFGGYTVDPIDRLARAGATLFINISASPFVLGKDDLRKRLIGNHVARHKKPFIIVNQVGGNDELVFDGDSLYFDADGRIITELPAFEESIRTINIPAEGSPYKIEPTEKIEQVYEALVLGLRDYIFKTGFSRAVMGLSGGIDSAVVCALAAAALGPGNIAGIVMPSKYTSVLSITTARKLAENLGVNLLNIPIDTIYQAYLNELHNGLDADKLDVALENIQARIRGNILMAYSNRHGHLLLTTGNKSELATGYCTLYGDMAGGLAVISDVPKTMVYELAAYINRDRELIPQETIERPPTAELRPGQTDQDTLPPYDILDAILHYYIEDGQSAAEIIERGYESETVNWVIRAVNRNEYKRRQAPPGLKITSKAFGVGRRMPIAAKY